MLKWTGEMPGMVSWEFKAIYFGHFWGTIVAGNLQKFNPDRIILYDFEQNHHTGGTGETIKSLPNSRHTNNRCLRIFQSVHEK